MTTIVYHYESKTIAYDSRVTSGSDIDTDDEEKCIQRGDEFWFFAGSWCDREWFIGNFQEGEKCERSIEGCAFVVIGHDVYYCCEYKGYFARTLVTWDDAIGSGRAYALAALDFGKMPTEAIDYAKNRNSATGGKIRIHKVGAKRAQLVKA